jgi:hypothetical protein
LTENTQYNFLKYKKKIRNQLNYRRLDIIFLLFNEIGDKFTAKTIIPCTYFLNNNYNLFMSSLRNQTMKITKKVVNSAPTSLPI